MDRQCISRRRNRLPLLAAAALLFTGIWHLAAQVRQAPVTETDVVAATLLHYFTRDRAHHPADFEWTFTETDFVLKKEVGTIPADLLGRLLPAGTTADEIRGKWKLAREKDQPGQRLVLSEIKVGDRALKKEVRLAIYRTAPTVIRIGEPQYVFALNQGHAPPPPHETPSGKTRVELRSAPIVPGLALADSKLPIHWVSLTAEVDEKRVARGTLVLDATPPEFDEYGDLITGSEIEPVERKHAAISPLEFKCLVEPAKSGVVLRVNEPAVERQVYRLKSPKLKSTLLFATLGPGLTTGRLMVLGADNRVELVVELRDMRPPDPVRLMEPCHPGCFPAGTRVLVPGGVALIEHLRAGDAVMTIGADGHSAESRVAQVFTTRNQLVELRTERGALVTTRSQPVPLVRGGFQTVENLKAGERIWRWQNGRRAEVAVAEIAPTKRTERVFNIVVGESVVFVANNFLVRGKPPAPAPAAARASLSPPQ
jgi:hypothetical protein